MSFSNSSDPTSYKNKIKNNLVNNAVLFTTCIIVISLIFATSFTSAPIFPFGAKFQDTKIGVFIFLVLLFSITQFIFLGTIKRTALNGGKGLKQFHIRTLHKVIAYSQYVLIGILVTTVIQVTTNSIYNTSLLIAAIFITHFLAIGIMIELAAHFLNWFRFNHNLAILTLTISIISIAINLIFMLCFYTDSIRNTPIQISSFRGTVTPSGSSPSVFQSGYIISYIMSFILTWGATIFLLYNYSHKFGKIKFWLVLVIPLVYFLLQFQPQVLNWFLPFRFSNPILFGLVYTLLFSAVKPMGGILAGIAFWIIARSINQKSVRQYLLISACGIMLVFASNQAARLVYPPFPPIELGAICYLGLASYLILVGIYSSALSVANDVELRRSIRKSVEQQSNLLGNIGTAQLENQIQKTVLNKTRDLYLKLGDETGVQSSLEERDLQNYIQMAINETKKTNLK